MQEEVRKTKQNKALQVYPAKHELKDLKRIFTRLLMAQWSSHSIQK